MTALGMPPSLSPHIFNEALFSRILQFWFAELPPRATAANPQLLAKWFGRVSQQQKLEFDAACRAICGDALVSLGPEHASLPPFQGYDHERDIAPQVSGPFRDVIQRCSSQSSTLRPADVALAMMLLLDQMPRNCFRYVRELGQIYWHYDRMSRALLYCILHPYPADGHFNVHGLDYSEEFGYSPVYGCFFYVALQHSEDLADHDEFNKRSQRQLQNLRSGDFAAAEFVKAGMQFESEHRLILERFGRYPYRNTALGRKLTTDEEIYLKEGGKTFGTESGL